MKNSTWSALVMSGVLMAGSTCVTAAGSDGEDSIHNWQLSLLFDPSPAQLRAESRGRVMIYDGLKSADINRAMKEHFGRVENMMFVNTVVTDTRGEPVTDPETGVALVEDDGCD